MLVIKQAENYENKKYTNISLKNQNYFLHLSERLGLNLYAVSLKWILHPTYSLPYTFVKFGNFSRDYLKTTQNGTSHVKFFKSLVLFFKSFTIRVLCKCVPFESLKLDIWFICGFPFQKTWVWHSWLVPKKGQSSSERDATWCAQGMIINPFCAEQKLKYLCNIVAAECLGSFHEQVISSISID